MADSSNAAARGPRGRNRVSSPIGAAGGVVAVLLLLVGGGFAREAVPQRPGAQDARPSEVAGLTSLLEQARAFRKKGEFPPAIKAYGRALELAEKQWAPDHPKTLEVVRLLAEASRAAGDYDQAIKLFRRCYSVAEPQLNPQAERVPEDLEDLATSYLYSGQFALAEKGLLAALERRKSLLGPEHPLVANVQFALGEAYMLKGDWLSAEEHFQASVEVRRKALGPRHVDLARSLQRLGMSRLSLHDYEGVEALLKEALAIYEAELGRPHARIAEVETELGEYYYLTGRPLDRFRWYQRGAETLMAIDDLESRPSIRARHRLAMGLRLNRQYGLAEKVYKETLELAKRSLGPRDPEIPIIVGSLGSVYVETKRSPQAAPLFLSAIEIMEKRYGPNHRRVSYCLGNLADAYYRSGQLDEAEEAYRRCIKIQRKISELQVFVRVLHLGGLLYAKKEMQESLQQLDEGIRELHGTMTRFLPLLPDTAKSYFMTLPDYLLAMPFSIAVDARHDQRFVDRSAEWLINMKGLGVEALAERTLTARDTYHPQAGKSARDLLEVRDQLAQFAVVGNQLVTDGPRGTKVRDLLDRERTLSMKLGKITQRRMYGDSWTPLERVRRLLPEDMVLVEILEFQTYEWMKEVGKGVHYFAWVIPPEGRGDVQLVHLGSTKVIEAAVVEYLDEIKASPKILSEQGEKAAEERLRTAGDALSSLVIVPLEAAIGRYPRWLISPDSALWLIPWAAMPIGDGKYLIERYEVTYTLTGRNLEKDYSKAAPSQPVIVANPDYDLGLPRELAGTGPYKPLPGVAAEARDVLANLGKYANERPLSYTEERATEGVVKSLRGPQVLVVSTHGYHHLADPRRPDSPSPLLRCGLALAGANAAGHEGRPGGEDGILTGLEVVGMELRGTELVVLSACESAFGRATHREGMRNLRGAFHLAGARSVVAALWPVPDSSTAELMTGLFGELAAGRRKAEALRNAQLAMIQARRSKHQAAHPYDWAAFVITGQGD